MKKICALLLLCVCSMALLTGCGKEAAQQKDKNSLRIVTSFYPVYIATINVTKDVPGVEVVNMTKPQTGCLHDYQLSTEDMKTLESADVFVVNGGGMESFLDKVVSGQKNLKIVDASQGIDFLHDEEGVNPHVWVSVSDAILQVENIAAQLGAVDPAHIEQYQKNAAAYIEKLTALQQEMHAKIDNLPHKDIVTFHEAFPYFAKEFNLQIISVIEREPGTEPSPQELKETISKVNSLPVKVLFAEPQYSPEAAKTIAAETGAKVYTLDPIVSGPMDENAYDAYLAGMKQNADTLAAALK